MNSNRGRKEYESEVKIISRLRHHNLVELIGWYHRGDELLLVSELVPNWSLDTHIHNLDKVMACMAYQVAYIMYQFTD
jgi:serine/threonine protein kinase